MRMLLTAIVLGLPILGMGISYPTFATDEDIYNGFYRNFYEDAWEKLSQVYRGVKKYLETHCDMKEGSADIVESELKSCIRPRLKGFINSATPNKDEKQLAAFTLHDLQAGTSLTLDQINLLRQRLTGPSCKFILEFLHCAKPSGEKLSKMCNYKLGVKKMEYLETLTKSVCHQNGEQLLDFLGAGGIQCLDPLLTETYECLTRNDTFHFEHLREAKTNEELCNQLGVVQNCLSVGVTSCSKEKPSKIIRSITEEMRAWIYSSCLTNGAERQMYSGVSEILSLILTIFIARFMM